MTDAIKQYPWSKVSQRWGHPWHSMCSYLACFPPALARTFILLLSNEGDTVLDPFCGRGTTLLEARLTGRIPIASDLNPIAVALTRAKNVNVSHRESLERIADLERNFDLPLYLPEARVQDEGVQLIYHPYTLARLCYLRRNLVGSSSPVDEFLVGAVLGIMHGAERRDGTSSYVSINMPNTFSMSPEYVRRFVQSKGLQRVERDVFQILRDKVDRLSRGGGSFASTGYVLCADAKALTVLPELAGYRGRVDLVVTSPPYLDIVNYARQNWIRMWFLGEDPDKISETLDDNHPLGPSLDFLEHVAGEIKGMLRPSGVMVLVIGDVARGRHSVISPARDLIRRLYAKKQFSYIGCMSDYLDVEEKTTRIWKETKGRATATERILILADGPVEFKVRNLKSAFATFGQSRQEMDDVDGAPEFVPDVDTLAEYARSFAGL